jgi:hypothetical protein
MQARRCAGCGAPLPDTDHGERPTCRFCGLVHDATSPSWPSMPLVMETAAPPRTGRGAVAIISTVFLIAVLAPLAFVYVQWRAGQALAPLRTLTSTTAALTKKARTPRELRDVPRGYHDLDVSPPPGGYGAIDAVATLPWALTIAQAWSGDARLERIDIDRLRPDGTVNAADDSEARVTYRFVSPARTDALFRQAELSAKAEANIGLWVRVSEGRPQVYADYSAAQLARILQRVKTSPAADHPAALPLTALVARPSVRRVLKPVPFYKGYLIHIEREGWVWYLSTLANEGFPRVRARDGAPYPYPR